MRVRSVSAGAAPGQRRPVERFFEYSLLGLLISGYFAVAGSGFLDLPTMLAAGLALVLRALSVTGWVRLEIPPRAVTAATIAYIGFYPVDYEFVSRGFVAATLHLVFFLVCVKVLTGKTRRDAVYLKLTAFLELLAACLLSTNFNFFVFLTTFLLFAIATFASEEVYRCTAEPVAVVRGSLRAIHWRLAGLSACLFLGILIMTGGLFFLLPRTARAAFQHLVSHHDHLSGFANEVVLGQIGEIKQSNTPVMHVRLIGGGRPPVVKWRGTSLSRFDGRRWYNPTNAVSFIRPEEGVIRLNTVTWQATHYGRRVGFEIHQKDIASETLFFAGTPEVLRVNSPFIIRSLADSYRVPAVPSTGLVYEVYSLLDDNALARPPDPGGVAEAPSEEYLSLPQIDGRIVDLSRAVTAGAKTAGAKARAIEQYLRHDFSYTLQLPSTQSADPLADFLFVRRRGHCEYFASAMAVMLRTLKVPSRVVTGFQGGVYNPISGWQLVRASDAHSWVEAWLPQRGWVTFDPTPPDPSAAAASLTSRLALYLDAAEVFWQDWVLSYDLERQLVLASRMQESSRKGVGWADRFGSWIEQSGRRAVDVVWRNSLTLAVGVVAALIALLYGGEVRHWWRAHRRVRKVQKGLGEATDATILYERMLALLRRRGIEKPAWLTPFEFARVVPASDIAPVVYDLTAAYNDLRFGKDREAAPRMVALLERLERL